LHQQDLEFLWVQKKSCAQHFISYSNGAKFAEDIIVSTKTEVIYLQTPRAFLMSPVAAATF